jgi:patatin-like phospholipase/acyl hydrolase
MGGLRLLSCGRTGISCIVNRSSRSEIDGGGVRGLSSLLVLERIMREITRLEIEADPSPESRRRVRIPADYFDLAGGTSTGG